jgi:methyl halide transferase
MAQQSFHHPHFWDTAYREGDARWDLGTPSPVFACLLKSGSLVPGKTCVVGCGRGHDAVLFAENGFAVTAVDFSSVAIQEASSRAAGSRADIRWMNADLFSLPVSMDRTFQYVIEYVTYCAVDPARRSDYANAVARLLAPGGIFVALFFPVEPREDGPPFGVDREEVLRIFGPHLKLISSSIPTESVRPRLGREWLTLWVKEDGTKR